MVTEMETTGQIISVQDSMKFLEPRVQLIIIQMDGEELILAVSDTGMGIPKEALGKLFERFYRVRHAGQQIKGTGLGLAIVKKIVEMHNGRITVESEVDRGTTFTVYLPLVHETTDTAVGDDQSSPVEQTAAS